MTDQPIIETFESVEWKDFPNAPGVQYVDVEGSISSPGPFLARVRFPGGIDTPPHRHEAPFIDRNTVISGTLFVGIGETFDKTKGIAVPRAGSSSFHLVSLILHGRTKRRSYTSMAKGPGCRPPDWASL